MHGRRISVCAESLLVMCLCATPAPAQQVTGQIVPRDRLPPPRTGTAVVRGRVVDGVSGTAVARARVTLQSGQRRSIVTDASGAFAFAGLPPGPLMLMVEKPTFLPARYPAAGRTVRSSSRPLVLADGQTLENVSIPVYHGAAITGRVLDANGDPLDNVQLSVFRIPSSGRVGRPTMRGGASSDDRGEFRIGRLEAGTYILQATARRGPNPEDMMPGAPPAPPSPQPLPTYYPGALTIEQAQPITVDRGQTASDTDIVLAEGFPGVVTGVVTMANGAPIAGMNAFINSRRVATDTMGSFDAFGGGASVRPDGTFRMTLPPGEYQLDANVTPRSPSGIMRPEDQQFGSVKVTVTSGSEDAVSIPVGPGATASGRVIFEGTTPAPPSPGTVHVPMFSETGQCRSGQATIAADWTFRIAGLGGTCTSQPMAMFGRWMLKAVIVDGENAADTPITFQTGQQFRNVQVIVTDKRSELVVRVAEDSGQTTREYVAVVFPVEKSRWNAARILVGPTIDPALVRGPQTASQPGMTATASPPRREMISGLRPGDYFVVAVDDLEPEDYRDPVVLDRLRSSSVRVTLQEGATIEVPLRRISFADAMARR